MDFTTFINAALKEDVGSGDYSSLCCIPENAIGNASIIAKQSGIISGLEIGSEAILQLASNAKVKTHKQDGESIRSGDLIMAISAKTTDILRIERLILNIIQRMSGIATFTYSLKEKIKHTNAILLDTRKTTPLFRQFEKAAVKHGGGQNHRMGLYDMIMLKDNHIDFAGGIAKALVRAKNYTTQKQLAIPIEIETRNLNEVRQALETQIAHRIMLDNFSLTNLKRAVEIIGNNCQTEASGNITANNIVSVAETGVQYISVGALTHSAKWLDLSLQEKKQSA